MVTDPGRGRRSMPEWIAFHGSRRRKRGRNNIGNGVRDIEASTRGSPHIFLGGTTWGDWQSQGLDLSQLWGACDRSGTMLCSDTHGVSSAHSQPGVLGASSPHLPCEREHTARTGCAGSALRVSSPPPRSRISCAGSKQSVSSAPTQPSTSCARSRHMTT